MLRFSVAIAEPPVQVGDGQGLDAVAAASGLVRFGVSRECPATAARDEGRLVADDQPLVFIGEFWWAV